MADWLPAWSIHYTYHSSADITAFIKTFIYYETNYIIDNNIQRYYLGIKCIILNLKMK